MFTGIVDGIGLVRRRIRNGRACRLEILSPFSPRSIQKGGSLAVNGCCLTVAKKKGRVVAADLSPETLKVTNLGQLRVGDSVNLEQSLRVGGRWDGHLVQGHVDGVGRVEKVERNGRGSAVEISFPHPLRRYFAPKGSIAVDGVSMTIHRISSNRLTLSVIPETLKRTTFSRLQRGDYVNLEVDIIAKYVENFALFRRGR